MKGQAMQQFMWFLFVAFVFYSVVFNFLVTPTTTG